MKYLHIALLVLSITLLSSLASSCKQEVEKSEKMENVDKSGPEYSSAYVCPMHCKDSGSAEPGKCPVCSMKYVVNEDKGHEGHNHDHGDHDGHNH